MESGTSDNFNFSSTWIMRSDKSEHTSSLIFLLYSGEVGTDDVDFSLIGDESTLGSSIWIGKMKV